MRKFAAEIIGTFALVFAGTGAVVIDDVTMDITHVLRGQEHISNTPRQIAVYRSLQHARAHL